MKKFLICIGFLAAFSLQAEELLPDLRAQSSGGTIFEIREVRLIRVEPDGLRVYHSTGMAKVPFELLPKELRTKYGFKIDAAREHRKAVAEATVSTVTDQRLSVPQVPAAPSVALSTVELPAPSTHVPHVWGSSFSFPRSTTGRDRSARSVRTSRGNYYYVYTPSSYSGYSGYSTSSYRTSSSGCSQSPTSSRTTPTAPPTGGGVVVNPPAATGGR